MELILHFTFLTLLTVFAILAVMTRNLLYAAFFLAGCSIALALFMVNISAFYVAMFELSVCAGLITVLFIGTVGMIQGSSKFSSEKRFRFNVLPILVLILGLALIIFSEPLSKVFFVSAYYTVMPQLGDIIWVHKNYEILGQICIFVAAVLAIKTFFFKKKEDK